MELCRLFLEIVFLRMCSFLFGFEKAPVIHFLYFFSVLIHTCIRVSEKCEGLQGFRRFLAR